MEVTKAYLDPDKKWTVVVEGRDRNKIIRTFIAIPPTSGSRTDIYTPTALSHGYNYGIEIILISVINGNPDVKLFLK